MRRKLWQHEGGAAAVEFGLALPVLMLILLGAIDFGRFGHAAVTVANAARTGAAYCDYATCTLASETIAAIKDRVLHEICPATVCPPATPSITVDPNNITVSAQTYDAVNRPHCPCLLVRVEYQFVTLIPWPGIPASFTTGHEALIPIGIQS